MATSPEQSPEASGRSAGDTEGEDAHGDTGRHREEDLDPDGQGPDLEPLGAGEGDLDPDDDTVDPEDMNIPPAAGEG